MVAYLVLLVAALTRFLPHTLHGVGMNFTAVGGGLLFFGAKRPRWQAAMGMVVMALTDVLLTTKVYGYPFHVRSYVATWVWYAAVCLIGSQLLRKVSVLRVAGGVLASATSFFVLSNFMVWAGAHVAYPHTFAGLGTCYFAALPFYFNDLASTTITVGALFGLPVVAAKLVEVMRSQQSRNEPLA